MKSKAFTGAWLVAAALLSSWAVSAAADQKPAARAAAPVERPHDLPAVSVEVEAEIARLTARTQAAPAGAPPGRNLFEFGVRSSKFGVRSSEFAVRRTAAPKPARADVVSLDLGTPNAELETLPALSAVADTGGGTLTAVISFHDELHFVKKGDVIAGRYRVDGVSLDGVDVSDLTLGTILRLSLQRPM